MYLCAFPESSDGAADGEPSETSGAREGTERDDQNDRDHEGMAGQSTILLIMVLHGIWFVMV